MADPQIAFNGDATSLLKAYADLDVARKKELQSLQTFKKENDAVSKAERDAAKEAEQIKAKSLSAQDKHNAAVMRAKELLDKGRLSQREYNAELERQRDLLVASGDAADGLAGKAVDGAKEITSSIVGFGSALGAVMAVVGAIKAEYEDLRRREADRAKVHVTFGDAMRGTLINFAPDAGVNRGNLEDRIKGIALETGASDVSVAQAASSALSSKANLDNTTALEAVRQAFRVAPHDPSAADELASRSLHLMASTGQTDPRAVMGLLTQAQGKSTITNLKSLGQNLLPAAVSGLATGDSAEQAAELFVTLNSLMKDKEGSVSKTASINLGAKLAEALPDLPNSESRMAALRADPARLAKFLAENKFDAQSNAPIQQLLSGEAGALAIEKDVRAGIGGFETGAASFEAFVAGIEGAPSQFLPAKERKSAANLREFKHRKSDDASAGVANMTFEETLQEIDFPGLDAPRRWLASSDVFALTSRGMSRPQAEATVLGGVLAGSLGSNPDPATVQLLQDQIRVLNEIARGTSAMAAGAPPEKALGK